MYKILSIWKKLSDLTGAEVLCHLRLLFPLLPPPPPPPAATAADDVKEEDDAEEKTGAEAEKIEESSLWGGWMDE